MASDKGPEADLLHGLVLGLRSWQVRIGALGKSTERFLGRLATVM